MSRRDADAAGGSAADRSTPGDERSAGAAPMPNIETTGEDEMKTRTDAGAGADDSPKSLRRVRASEVLGPRGILLIEHEGEVYTLRVTRNNRLILTK